MDLYFLYLAKKRSLDYRLPPRHLYFLSFAWMVVVHKLGQIMKTIVATRGRRPTTKMIDDRWLFTSDYVTWWQRKKSYELPRKQLHSSCTHGFFWGKKYIITQSDLDMSQVTNVFTVHGNGKFEKVRYLLAKTGNFQATSLYNIDVYTADSRPLSTRRR